MTTGQLLTGAWHWDPSVVFGCNTLLVLYAVGLRFRLSRAAWWFVAGVLVLLISLVSPIDTLGDTYLFSAHMIQHMLLLLVVPPLLLLGLPESLATRLLAWPPARAAERIVGQPAVAWLLATGTLWIWHVPTFYDAALAHEGLHVVEHLLFLISATLFWWPLLTPLAQRRLGAAPALLYLITATIANDLLGIIITFAPVGLYPPYLRPHGDPRILALVRETWGLAAADDQQLAGVLMWMAGSLPYAAAILGILARWLGEPDADLGPDEAAPLPAAPRPLAETPARVPGSTI